MTLTRYVVVKVNGTILKQYNSGSEILFKSKEQAERAAISWGKVKEIYLEIPE